MRNTLMGMAVMALFCSLALNWALIFNKFLVNGGYVVESPPSSAVAMAEVGYNRVLDTPPKGRGR